MMNEKEFQSMLYLLDDSDERVVEHVENQITLMGMDALPFLEKYWSDEANVVVQERMVLLIKKINQQLLLQSLRIWEATETQDLLEGVLIIDQIANPNLDRQLIENQIDKIKLDAWLELNYDLTSFEKVKILNQILFDAHGFCGDTESYHSSKNSFISSVLERKKGNPISLSVLYIIIAQRLNIPIFGVNLPQHFILGYVNEFDWMPLLQFNDASSLLDGSGSEIMFYINPFNKGLIFNRDNIIKFLQQLKIEPSDEYFKACSNKDILVRILRNLETSYATENNTSKLELVSQLVAILVSDKQA
jgi:regulator of sirC expression with transglutaminase-like and TPR domain|tara:strand:+ start:2151 stop:3062 length:912 start_codon:yes stop_codon:yes gene_type:complete